MSANHLDLVASRLEDCRAGRTRRLIINLPPRELKSMLASVAFPAFLLGHEPGLAIICASYGQDLSEALARDCRTILTSDWYRALFPRTRIVREAVHDLGTSARGFRLATSVGGPLTGRGADVIIIDDPLKPDDALSEAKRSAVNDWFDNTLLSRLNSQERGVIVITMQRLHTDDLVGHVLGGSKWGVLSLPAIAEEDEDIAYDMLLGRRRFRRPVGKALNQGRTPLARLAEIRAAIGSYNFASQYQQSPVSKEGNLVKSAWLQRYSHADVDQRFEYVIQSWDTANKAGELNDYSVCTTWGVRQRRYYLLDVFRKRLEFPDLKRAVRQLSEQYRPQTTLIEDKASGTQLIQELTREGLYSIKAVETPAGTDKVMRLHMHTATFENGRILVPEKAAWLEAYITEITGFPGTKHDDQVDSTTQALTFLDAYRPPMVITQAMLTRARMPTAYSRSRAGY